MKKIEEPSTMYCPTCKKDIKPIKKMFHVKLCPGCNKILSSDYPIEKG